MGDTECVYMRHFTVELTGRRAGLSTSVTPPLSASQGVGLPEKVTLEMAWLLLQ